MYSFSQKECEICCGWEIGERKFGKPQSEDKSEKDKRDNFID
jgi:hypothetical protein